MSPLSTAVIRMTGESTDADHARVIARTEATKQPPTLTLPRLRGREGWRRSGLLRSARNDEVFISYAGIGKTALALAESGGRITLMSLSSTWVLTGGAPSVWALTNLVGPYGMMWPENVEFANAAVTLARSTEAACSSASATS